MKTLIQNYTSTLSTEAMYIHRCLLEAGESVHLWTNQNQSAFDTFDFVKPDLFISHYKFLTRDIIKYLSQNKNISMTLNVTGASQENINTLEQIVKDNGINVPLIFTNLHESISNIVSRQIPLKHIYPAADVFLPALPTPEYEVKSCFLTLENSEMLQALKPNGSYHIVSFNQPSEDRYADMYLDVTSCVSFYDKYEKCILVGDINFVTSQMFYDCMLRCKSITVKVPNEQEKAFNTILASLFNESDSDDMSALIKNQVKSRHNCIKRTARLFRQLRVKELGDKLERMGDRQ